MSSANKYTTPALLDRNHNTLEFDCGAEALNNYLKNFALINNQNGSARTYVTSQNNKVIGYYTLAPGSVNKERTPLRVGKGLAAHPVPVVILARLAVDKSHQGRGVGKALLREALLRIIDAAESIGGRAVLVHVKDEQLRHFYEQYGFETSPIDPLHYYLLIKDIKQSIG